ncbi:LCP family protein [Actinopolymorpha rutila]|uniref:LCP family protein required for cell wall assembly n=1 Tax=Actinopolymorpha rutila TaxID=446787 RepID=A0A852ZK31_9ACTN|nr:LCP family protein required for cell wall assembly [Actinopolymorpha rutila]
MLLLVVAMVSAVAVARAIVSRLNDNLRTFDARGIDTDRPPPAKPGRTGATPVNVLLLGSDSRAGANDQLAGGTGSAGRSDTAIVVHVYADRRRAVAVSIPRDALVDIPRCRLHGGNWAAPRRQTMFNAAFNTGSTAAGNPACTQNTVEKLTGFRIDHTIVVDFKGFAAITEAVDGVRVCVPNDVHAGDLDPGLSDRGSLLFAKGMQNVSGRRALDYVRLRHGIGDGSDIGRIKRQQAFLASLAAKVRRSGIDPTTLAPLAEAATRALTVDPGLGSAPKLVAFAMSLRHLSLHDIQFVTVPSRYAGRTKVAFVQPAADRVWATLRADRPLGAVAPSGGEQPPGGNRPLTGLRSPEGGVSNNRAPMSGLGIEVGVYNGTTVPRLARAAASQLQTVGFTVGQVVDGGQAGVATTTITYDPGHYTDARTLATLFPRARLLPTAGPGGADDGSVNLVLGRDYAARTTTAETPPTSVPAVRPRTAADNPCEDLSYGPPIPTR